MPLTRQQKEQRISEVKDTIKGATSVVFMSYDGLTVDDSEDLRDKLFESKSSIKIVPKRLLNLALKAAELEFDPTNEAGQIAMAWGEDAVAPAKVLHTFAKKNEKVRLVAGILEGAVLSGEQIMALAQLPSKEQLLGQFVSVLVGPVRGLQSVLSGAQRDFVYALSAIAEQKQKV